jgi:hypothetical protein
MVGIAIMTMIIAVTAQHLGLTEAIAKVITKIAVCYKCCTMWLTFAALLYCGYELILSLLLSIIVAYASHYYAIVLILSQRLYNKIWARLNEKIKKNS